jgi:hypothetical protein
MRLSTHDPDLEVSNKVRDIRNQEQTVGILVIAGPRACARLQYRELNSLIPGLSNLKAFNLKIL